MALSLAIPSASLARGGGGGHSSSGGNSSSGHSRGSHSSGGHSVSGGHSMSGGHNFSGGQRMSGSHSFSGGSHHSGSNSFSSGIRQSGSSISSGAMRPGGNSFSGSHNLSGGRSFGASSPSHTLSPGATRHTPSFTQRHFGSTSLTGPTMHQGNFSSSLGQRSSGTSHSSFLSRHGATSGTDSHIGRAVNLSGNTTHASSLHTNSAASLGPYRANHHHSSHGNGTWNHHPNGNGNTGNRSSFYFGLGYPFGFGLGFGSPYSNYGYRRSYGSPYYCYSPSGIGVGLGYGLGYGYGSNYGYSPYDAQVTTPLTAVNQTVASVSPDLASTPTQGFASEFTAQGEADFKAARYDHAIRSWRHALVDDPDNGALVLLLAQGLFATGRYDEAAGAVQAGMSMLPQDKWGLVVSNYSELYRGNQDYTDQLRALENASEKTPDSPAMRFLLGYHYAYLGYPKQAVRELTKAGELAPQDELTKKLLAEFTAKLKPGELPPAATPALLPAPENKN